MESFGPSTMKKPKNKWKIVGIIFIVLSVLALAAGGFLGWKYFDHKNQIDALNTEKDKISQERDDLAKKNAATTGELSEEEAAQALAGKPSAETLLKAMGSPAHIVAANITVGEIHNSSIEPYQAITADIKPANDAGFQATFYRANDKTAWVHWNSDSDQCSAASGNDTLIRSIADFNCYADGGSTMNSDGPTTYKVYFKL